MSGGTSAIKLGYKVKCMKTRCHWIYTARSLSGFPGFWSNLTYFCKNHGEFSKYNVLAMCRVNDMANKMMEIQLDPTPSLVGNIAAVACYIATQNTKYTIWQFKESTSHSLFETTMCMQYGVIFSITVCLSTCKDLLFTSFQRTLMLSMFLAMFSSVKHAIFVYITNELSNMLTYFFVTSGYVNHIRIHIC